MTRVALFTCESCGVIYEKQDTARNRRRTKCRTCSLPRGTDHYKHNGGLTFCAHSNRWRVICRDGSMMWYARAVLAGQIGRLLATEEHAHHINHDTTDDRPENLRLMGRTEHGRMHGVESGVARRAIVRPPCACGAPFYALGKCERCYRREATRMRRAKAAA